METVTFTAVGEVAVGEVIVGEVAVGEVAVGQLVFGEVVLGKQSNIVFSRHPGEPDSKPFSLGSNLPDFLNPHPRSHPTHPLQDREHPPDYSTDQSIVFAEQFIDYDLENVDQLNEIEDGEEEEEQEAEDEEGLDDTVVKDQDVDITELNRSANLKTKHGLKINCNSLSSLIVSRFVI